MVQFLFGLITGGVIGAAVMCLLQINRVSVQDTKKNVSKENDFEKTAAVGVDNTAKKA